jgi:hypothetical protein
MSDLRVYYFGCWQRAGHGLYHVGGSGVHPRDGVPFDPFDNALPLDGTLAPRRAERWFRVGVGPGRARGDLCFAGEGWKTPERAEVRSRSVECPQGEFLIHRLRGYTLMAWWDRTQGDNRGACNSVFLVEGERTAKEMLALWPASFPLQAANLERAGVKLVEVTL